MIVVVGVGLAGAGRQRHFREIVAAVFVGGGLFLQVGDAGYITVAVIDVAVTELLLKQLDPIKVYHICIVAVKEGDGNGAIRLGRNDALRRVLPVDSAVCAGIEGDQRIRLVRGDQL